MKKFNNTLTYISGILLLALTIIANIQVVSRFISIPMPWVEEAIRYLMIYIVFIMSAVGIVKKSHLNLDVIDILIKSPRKLLFISHTRHTLIFMFCAVYGYYGLKLILNNIKFGQVTPAMQMPMAIPLSAVVIGCILTMITSLYMVFHETSLYKRSESEG